MSGVIEQLRKGVIVSCQAEGDDPFNKPEYLALFARAAEMGGAAAIRTCGIENVRAISEAVSIPVIGLIKSRYADGSVLITEGEEDVIALKEAGADIIALDVTARTRPDGYHPLDLLKWALNSIDCPILADISTLEEGLDAARAGASMVGTTLAGYTPYTKRNGDEFTPDFALLKELCFRLAGTPVIAEGRIMTPEAAKEAIRIGAYAVVVGTAITRPRVMVQHFVHATSAISSKENT